MESNRNIALIGGRACGKSTIAELLAAKLNSPVLSTDKLIVQKAGKTIPQIVQKVGWPGFRELEYRVVQELSSKKGIIIDCGGGIICEQDENNEQAYSQRKVKLLKTNSIVIWLDCAIEAQLQRLGQDTNRPALTNNKSAKKELEHIMQLRRPWYQQAADYKISTNDHTATEITIIIKNKLASLTENSHD